MSTRSILPAWVVFVLFSTGALAQTTRFVALGDSRGGDNGINEPILTELAAAIIAENPDLVIFVGDLVTNGTQSQLQTWVAKFMDPLRAAGIDVYPVRGNHDADIYAWNTVFSGTHALPDNGPPGEENLTYSFVYRNAMFIGIDEYMPDHPSQVNQAWLDEQLASCTVPHVFTFGHLPAFAVYHTDCLATFSANRDIFWNSLARIGARTYFAGHDHFLNHARIATNNGGSMEQYIVGAAGAPLYSWSGVYPEATQVSIANVSHFMNYSYAVVDINGFDVTIDLKQKVAEGVYASTGDVFHYVAPFRGQGVPAAAVLAVVSITALFAFRGYAARTR